LADLALVNIHFTQLVSPQTQRKPLWNMHLRDFARGN